MIPVQVDGSHFTIDVREQIRRGEHPRKEILDAISDAPVGTLFEIHVPHRTGPLIAAIEVLGMNVVTQQLEPGHFRILTLKL